MIRETWRRQPATRLRPLVAPTIDLTTELTVTPGPLLWLLPSADSSSSGWATGR